MVLLSHFFLGDLVFLSDLRYCGDVPVEVTIGSENGCHVLQFRGLATLVTVCLLM
jgi:hypothetical protein